MIKRILYLTITISIVSFIFYNSMQNGTNSSQASTLVLNFINDILANFHINFSLSGHFVRKLAHFVEFFAFGFFLMLTLQAFTISLAKPFGFVLFFSILTPVIDEYIQIYSVGRTSSVKDVLLDFSGAMTGVFLIVLIFAIIRLKNKNKYKFYKY